MKTRKASAALTSAVRSSAKKRAHLQRNLRVHRARLVVTPRGIHSAPGSRLLHPATRWMINAKSLFFFADSSRAPAFNLSPWPPLHRMERGNGGEAAAHVPPLPLAPSPSDGE